MSILRMWSSRRGSSWWSCLLFTNLSSSSLRKCWANDSTHQSNELCCQSFSLSLPSFFFRLTSMLLLSILLRRVRVFSDVRHVRHVSWLGWVVGKESAGDHQLATTEVTPVRLLCTSTPYLLADYTLPHFFSSFPFLGVRRPMECVLTIRTQVLDVVWLG